MGTRRNYQRTSNKNDSPLHVLPVAEKLIDYTLDLTDNAKRFPKRVRFSITNKIQGHVMPYTTAYWKQTKYFRSAQKRTGQNGFVYKRPP